MRKQDLAAAWSCRPVLKDGNLIFPIEDEMPRIRRRHRLKGLLTDIAALRSEVAAIRLLLSQDSTASSQ